MSKAKSPYKLDNSEDLEEDIEFIEVDDDDIDYIITIEGVIHKWDFTLKEYRPVDSRRVNYCKKDFLH